MGVGRVPNACPNYNTLVTEIGIQKNDMITGVSPQHVKWDEDSFKKVFELKSPNCMYSERGKEREEEKQRENAIFFIFLKKNNHQKFNAELLWDQVPGLCMLDLE
jgi:hypothetical protein